MHVMEYCVLYVTRTFVTFQTKVTPIWRHHIVKQTMSDVCRWMQWVGLRQRDHSAVWGSGTVAAVGYHLRRLQSTWHLLDHAQTTPRVFNSWYMRQQVARHLTRSPIVILRLIHPRSDLVIAHLPRPDPVRVSK